MLVAVSCQLNGPTPVADVPQVEATTDVAATTTTLPKVDAGAADADALKLVGGGGKFFAGTMSKPTCDTAKQTVMVKTSLVTPFGKHALELSFEPAPDLQNEIVHARVDDYVVTFPAGVALGERLKTEVCAKGAADLLPIDAETALRLGEAIEHVAPDCERLELAATAFVCHLPGVDPEQARQELVGIQTTMIRRWSRQPYLLARRVAIGVTLASALESVDADKSFASFCRLVESAMPEELPATLASKRWQQAVCGADKSGRTAAARFGLVKTIGEVDAMRQLFESTSRLGHLAVRIQGKVFPGNRVLVSLTPDGDVAENLAKETKNLGEGVAAQSDTDAPRACWHPLFGETPTLLVLARQLALAGDTELLGCAMPASETNPSLAAERYFAESITSETEFVVSNGRAKTLRLPIGHYKYTLRVLPEDPGAWDDAAQVEAEATGTIAWDQRRPHAVISSW